MSPADCEKQGKFWLCTLDFVLLSKHQAGSTARRFLCTSVSSGMMKKRWQQLTALVCIVLLSRFGTAQKLTSKQWLHSHCKAYQEDYAPLVIKFLSRYQGGINVADVLNLKVPPGRSASVADGARPVVYLTEWQSEKARACFLLAFLPILCQSSRGAVLYTTTKCIFLHYVMRCIFPRQL